MRSTVVVLAQLLASGCGDDDGSTPADGTAGTTDATGVGDVANPDGSSDGADDDGDTSGGLLPPGDDDGSSSSGGEPEGFGEQFEDVLVGEQPGDPWFDIADRIEDPTVPSPTAMVIDTVGPDGEPTRALQLQDAIGTSQGIFADVEPAPFHRVTASVRVDQTTDAIEGLAWPIAVGLSQSVLGGDLNDHPHAIVAAHSDGSWHLRINNDPSAETGLDMTLPFPDFELDRWYRVSLEAETDSGSFHVELFDPATGELLGEQVALAPSWDESYAEYDAIAFFDGEYGVRGGSQGGIASVDDIEYEPTP